MKGAGAIGLQLLRFVFFAGVHMLLISRLPALFELGWCFFYLGFLLFLPSPHTAVLQGIAKPYILIRKHLRPPGRVHKDT